MASEQFHPLTDEAGNLSNLVDPVKVELGERSYPIYIGTELIEPAGDVIKCISQPRHVMIVSDSNVAPLYGEALADSVRRADIQVSDVVFEAGEASKSFAKLQQLCRAILTSGLERGDSVIALGGGVIGDLAGFAAAITRRGLHLVQMPTSLLAQVDSSVGGKTGINTPEGKNLIGAFHQPALVLADLNTLSSLPQRELCAGYAEIVKYALLGDSAFFDWLENNGAAVLAKQENALHHAVATSCRAKAAIVAADEHEHGTRALLNLGHTFGHALETALGYDGRLIHGEAVAIGMVLAFELSQRLKLCPAEDVARVITHLKRMGLPTSLQHYADILPAADGLLRLMQQDKKSRKGRLTFVLTRGIGQAFTTQDVELAQLQIFLEEQLQGTA